ncbi:MAG: Membrane protein implicated in regulation of rane protease [Thermoleophilia bacterium]|jgi:membrane protein implicated in regulation of membrane protease activity|nr:Membrane protein implicated in regulation of rane protease [Thermoleophilia bacterium]
MDPYLITWIALAALFAIVELATLAFVSLYFALGSVAAAIVAGSGGDLVWQLTAFVATGAVLLAVTRPVFKRRLESPDIHTNVSLLIGKGGIVTIPISNDNNTGQIRVGTEYWTARLPHGLPDQTIPVDSRVTVVSVEGVTARVEPRGEAAPSAATAPPQ